jgi:GNAT superfamily N-acetyltransferase
MSHEIVRVDESEVLRFRKQAVKEGLSFVDNTEYALLRVDGKDAGFCGIRWFPTRAVFRNLYVLPEYRGKGYGSDLIRYQIARAREMGRSSATAYTNWNSQSLYLAAGGVLSPNERYYGMVTFPLNDRLRVPG